MLTTSTQFDTFAASTGHQRDVILIVSLGSVNRYFSMRPMPRGLETPAIYPLLHSVSEITEGFDIYSKRNQISDVKFILSDEKFFPQTGTAPIRSSELLENLNGATITLVLWVDGVTSIDDCLVIFKGKVLQALTVSNSRAQFSAHSIGKLWDIEIPTRVIKNQWPNAPLDTQLLPIPIVYGRFAEADPYLDNDSASGLTRAVSYEKLTKSAHVVADHPVADLSLVSFRTTGALSVVPDIGGTVDHDDNGIAIVTPSLLAQLSFDLDATLPGVYNDETFILTQTDRDNLVDGVPASRCLFTDNVSDDGDFATGLALWGIALEAVFRNHIQTGGIAQLIGVNLDDEDWIVAHIQEIETFLYYGVDGSTDFRTTMGKSTRLGIGDDGLIAFTGALDMGNHFVSGGNLSVEQNVGEIYAVAFTGLVGTNGGATADTIVDNQDMFSLEAAQILYSYLVLQRQTYVWATVNGKAAGNALTVGRANPYSSTSINEDPALIIEDLYRTFIGLSDVEIDTASFDAGYNASAEIRVSITDKIKISDLARDISEQSTILTYISGVGQLKCIDLDDKNPTINETITRAQLVGDEFKLSKTTFIINDLNVKSRWQGEHSAFKDEDVFSDADSQVQVDVRTGQFGWKFLNGTDNSYVGDHYVNSDDGIWSKEHIKVVFTTAGFTHSHLQAGDWIDFAADIDDIRTAYGRTWAGIDLLVIETQKGSSNTTVTAIELYRPFTTPSPDPSPSPLPSPINDGLYDRDATVDITLPANIPLTDTVTTVEVGSDLGYIANNDHYGLDFGLAVELNTGSVTFTAYSTRVLSTLTNGACDIYYSDDNSTWTKWGTTRSYLNSGITKFNNTLFINGDGATGESHRYWKIFVISSFSDGSAIEMSELTAAEV